jgi:cell wall-associated NlpC family hydrolase
MRRLVGVAVALCVLAAGPSARADPSPQEIDQQVAAAQAQLDRLQGAESAAVEAANSASDQLARAFASAIAARRAGDAAIEELSAAREVLAARAVALYKGGGAAGQLATLLESRSPDEVVERLRYLRGMGERDRARIDRVARAQRDVTRWQSQVDALVATRIRAGAQRDAELAKARQAVTSARQLLSSLDARRRAAVEATLYAAMIDGASIPRVHVSLPGLQAAIDRALQQVGTPYVWGGERPGGFDCSGLVRYAFEAAGLDVPHRADLQWFLGSHPSQDQLLPGDLVFYSNDGTAQGIHHVGIYLGEGLMVVAPYSGAVVRVQSFRRPDYLGATRLLG